MSDGAFDLCALFQAWLFPGPVRPGWMTTAPFGAAGRSDQAVSIGWVSSEISFRALPARERFARIAAMALGRMKVSDRSYFLTFAQVGGARHLAISSF